MLLVQLNHIYLVSSIYNHLISLRCCTVLRADADSSTALLSNLEPFLRRHLTSGNISHLQQLIAAHTRQI